jgi:hypothetical protein
VPEGAEFADQVRPVLKRGRHICDPSALANPTNHHDIGWSYLSFQILPAKNTNNQPDWVI